MDNVQSSRRFDGKLATMRKITSLLFLILLLACQRGQDGGQSNPNQGEAQSLETKESNSVNLKRTRFLLLDSRIIESTKNAKLELGTVKKHEANPLFVEDKPWEKRFDNLYGNVIYDKEDQLYKCWYSPFIVDHSAKGMTLAQRQKPYHPPKDREMGICYATSKDGIVWKKPNLGIVEYDGSKQNNIIWREPHGVGIFKDAHESDPQKRYKTIFQGLSVSFSADGIDWDEKTDLEGISVAGDTHNNAFWAPTLNKYVAMTRTWSKSKNAKDKRKNRWRQVARMESDDFVNWTDAKVVLEGNEWRYQTYAMPVFFHGGVYLGLLAVHDQESDRVWTELTWSPDTKEWNRVAEGTPLIPNSENELDYDYGCVYACANPVFLEDEIRLYYGGSDYLHFGWRDGNLSLATLRPAGFAGYVNEVPDQPAIILTTSIPYENKPIQISADVESGGSIEVSVLDIEGQEIARAKEITTILRDRKLALDRTFEGDEIRLKFEMKRAKLYSFSFGHD